MTHSPGRPRPAASEDERGSVTAEFALALPAVLVVVAVVIGVFAAGAQKARLEQTAGAIARELARGADEADARAAAHGGGGGLAVVVSREGDLARVEVTEPFIAWTRIFGEGVGPRVRGVAVARVEDLPDDVHDPHGPEESNVPSPAEGSHPEGSHPSEESQPTDASQSGRR